MSAPLKVCWLIWGTERAGVASATLNNALALAGVGAQCGFITLTDGGFARRAVAAGLPVQSLGGSVQAHEQYVRHGFSALGVARRVRALLGWRRPLRAALQSQKPDVLCLPWPDLMPLAGPLCRAPGIALVLEMPNTPSRYRFDLNQRLYALMVRLWRVKILANSQYTASRLKRVPGVAVVTPALDASRFDPAQVLPVARAALGIPADVIVVALVARLHPSKGAAMLVQAFAQLAAGQPRLHLLLVGGASGDHPDYPAQLLHAAQTLGLSERVHWVDAVADPERHLATADLVVNARIDAEPFGLSVIEAMLMAKPVIVHALGEPADIVDDGVTGWHYHTPTVEALARVLEHSLAHRADWPAMGAAARATALARYTGEVLAQRHLRLLQDHAGQARAP